MLGRRYPYSSLSFKGGIKARIRESGWPVIPKIPLIRVMSRSLKMAGC